MEKIIYNTKLKKFFISILVAMILITYVMPNKVYADLSDDVGEAVTDSAGNLIGFLVELGVDSLDGDTEGPYSYEQYNQLNRTNYNGLPASGSDEALANNLAATFRDKGLTEEQALTIIQNHKDDDLKIWLRHMPSTGSMIAGQWITNPAYWIVAAISVTLTPEESAEFGLTQEDIDNAVDDNVEDEDEHDADIGGILLSPVFYLINFIADAITSNLERIMIGEDASFGSVTGIGVLVRPENYQPPEVERTSDYEVDVDSFIFGEIQYPNIHYTPEEIFSGKIDLLSIDFISGKSTEPERDADGNIIYADNSNADWRQIRYVISEWYKVLRMIAIIGLLSVLIYTGIKIIISSNAKDKAKYKEWIINWFLAVAILFFMHYIMAFIINVIKELNGLLYNACSGINVVLMQNGTATEESFVTNLMGLVRFMIQSEDFYMKVGYEVMYIALIVYTIKFTVVYLKRVLNMAFLTLIAPIVALTYPIDKINDGKAQGFDMWLKEYIFNALLQPMHLIMYYILVGSAVGVAAANPIYGIVVLMFMTEAEKLLKKIFGFDKAGGGTVGGMAGAFAAGAIASNIKDIARMAKLPGGNAGKGGSGGGDKNNLLDNPKPTEKDTSLAMFEDPSIANNTTDSQESSDNNGTSPETMNDDRTEADEYADRLTEAGITDPEERRRLMEESGYSTDTEPEVAPVSASAIDSEPEIRSESVADSEPEVMPAQIETSEPEPDSESRSKPSRIQNFKKGSAAVRKKLIKPVWDSDKSKKYNGKRLLRNVGKTVGKAALGFSLGTAAAAVQAGISITDGKYSPMEGFATFSAGAVGGSKIVNGIGRGISNIADTYRDGVDAGDKEAMMKRAQERFADRDDVIAFNKKEYGNKTKEERAEIVQRERDNYLTRGVTDLKEMKKGMKYADTIVGDISTLDEGQRREARRKADAKAAATIDFRKTLESQGQLQAVYDAEKRQKYIDTMVKRAKDDQEKIKIRNRYENAFKSVAAYDEANR